MDIEKQQAILFSILDSFENKYFNMTDINIALNKLSKKGIILSASFINNALDDLFDNGYLLFEEMENGKWAIKNAKFCFKR